MIRGVCGVPALFFCVVAALTPASLPAVAAPAPAVNMLATGPARNNHIRLAADGSTLAFTDTSSGAEVPFRWRSDTGLTPLPFAGNTWINGISHDGALVLGA